jgi:pyruvate/2-oxoglutarate dehydrogenase complex dihydrolipoamide dehydrogenase (E3) component
VLGTGTSAAIPPIPGLADVPYWTNRAAIETEEVPASLAVLGGGAIGMELAQVFSRFGAKVTVVEAAERVLPLEEPESSQLIERVFLSEGIDVITGAKVEAVGERGGRIVLTTGGAAAGEISADRLLVATGRRTDLAALGVGSIGVDESARFLPVDERMRVGDGVWAVGDITGKGLFTHMAVYQARIAVADILGEEGPPASYHAVSRVTFTDPEIGSVGLSEREAREQGLRVRTRVYELPRSARGWIHKVGNDGIVKLVEDAGAGHLVGATTAGPSGGEMLGLLALAVHARIPTPELETMIYAYPTFHRAIGDAVREMLSGT